MPGSYIDQGQTWHAHGGRGPVYQVLCLAEPAAGALRCRLCQHHRPLLAGGAGTLQGGLKQGREEGMHEEGRTQMPSCKQGSAGLAAFAALQAGMWEAGPAPLAGRCAQLKGAAVCSRTHRGLARPGKVNATVVELSRQQRGGARALHRWWECSCCHAW